MFEQENRNCFLFSKSLGIDNQSSKNNIHTTTVTMIEYIHIEGWKEKQTTQQQERSEVPEFLKF